MRSLAILDTTLREGEQFIKTFFTLEHRLQIASLLDALGVTFIEVPSPVSSPETQNAIEALCELNLNAHIVPMCAVSRPMSRRHWILPCMA